MRGDETDLEMIDADIPGLGPSTTELPPVVVRTSFLGSDDVVDTKDLLDSDFHAIDAIQLLWPNRLVEDLKRAGLRTTGSNDL